MKAHRCQNRCFLGNKSKICLDQNAIMVLRNVLVLWCASALQEGSVSMSDKEEKAVIVEIDDEVIDDISGGTSYEMEEEFVIGNDNKFKNEDK